jgi:hypothetical protein
MRLCDICCGRKVAHFCSCSSRLPAFRVSVTLHLPPTSVLSSDNSFMHAYVYTACYCRFIHVRGIDIDAKFHAKSPPCACVYLGNAHIAINE